MNRFAIITGGSRGIGFAVARYFAEQGYDLALIAKDEARLNHAKAELNTINSAITIKTYSVDLTLVESSYQLIKNIIAERGHVDVVFNNAGICLNGCTDLLLTDFEKMLTVNVAAMFAVAKAGAEAMRQQGSGYIFNLASMAGKRGVPALGGYCATKHAVVGFSDALLKELLPCGIKVTALCPSVIDTDMTQNFSMENDKKISVSDIVTTVDYLLNLTSNAVIASIDILCAEIVKKGI